MTNPVKVLVVDDSPFMRRAIAGMLHSDPGIKVVGEAANGEEAVQKVRTLMPDIVTMDIEMPRMNGLDALRIIMKEHPLPVLMVSSLTEEGARDTVKALEYGAADYIPKSLSGNIVNIVNMKSDLIEKVKLLGRSKGKIKGIGGRTPGVVENHIVSTLPPQISIVVIGASTGGPKALQEVIPRLPKNFPAGILIIQHMLPLFTLSFAERMRELCQIEVREAKDGDVIKPCLALVAPGGSHIRIRRWQEGEAYVKLSKEPHMLHMPSIDIAMESVAHAFAGRTLGVIMTGMGQDGCEGIKAIKSMKGKAIAQDEETSVIFGMPKAAIESGLIDKVVPLGKIAEEIINIL